MAIKPVGYVLTNQYQKVLDGSHFHTSTEFFNNGEDTAYIIFGNQSLDDSHAIEVPVNASYFTQEALKTKVYAKGKGKMVVVADNNRNIQEVE